MSPSTYDKTTLSSSSRTVSYETLLAQRMPDLPRSVKKRFLLANKHITKYLFRVSPTIVI